MTVLQKETELTRALLATGRDPLASVVADALQHRCGVAPGARILVGFSGGADSTALLLLLCALSERAEPACERPIAVHVDHGLRSESRVEAEHALALCERLDVRCELTRVELDPDQADLARCARDARYAVMERIAQQHRVDAVSVAHHAEDRFESILQALCRGSGARGMASPGWSRPFGALQLVRPLLAVSRSSLVALCHRTGVPFVDDPTNERLDTARGLLRARVLDVLEERWPGAAQRASAAADRLEVAASALEHHLEESLGPEDRLRWPRHTFSGLAPGLGAAGLRRAIISRSAAMKDKLPASLLGIVADAAADDSPRPRVFALAGGWRAEVDVREVRLIEPDQSTMGG